MENRETVNKVGARIMREHCFCLTLAHNDRREKDRFPGIALHLNTDKALESIVLNLILEPTSKVNILRNLSKAL